MSVKRALIEVGLDKDGQFDFGISCQICDLSVDKMNDLRAMMCCAIGTAEDMFRREIERRNPACSAYQPAAPRGDAKEG